VTLAGRVALVTGASRGIGRAIARAYAGDGAVVGCLASGAAGVAAVVEEIAAGGGRAFPLVADVADAGGVARALDELVARAGGLDLVVANAGVSLDDATVEASDPTLWRRTLEVNLIGVYETVRLAIPHLARRDGARIIIVGSGTGHHARHSNAAYICSKAAVWALTRVLSDELRPQGISVNELVPGPVRTGIVSGEAVAGTAFAIAGEWVKRPEDVAPLALFLASCPPPGPTGQSFSLMRRTG
jgi:3-oxoacyl-[acyl-carrier protein] reductase